MKAMKRLLALEGNLSTSPEISPESFTAEMQSRQPDSVEIIRTRKLSPRPGLEARILRSIKTSKARKAPGPDKVRNEMLQLEPELFSKDISALWDAVGRLGYMTNILRSGFFAPIYKKGDPKQPANYRPINLLSVFRRIISNALISEIDEVYDVHRNQWG